MTAEYICPICAKPVQMDDLCSSDIDMGTCHAECLEGSPVVNLETGEPMEGPVPTYRFRELFPEQADDR